MCDVIEYFNREAPAKPGRVFFFDLADPEKRSSSDLVYALETIAKFEQFGRVTLGLNLKEAQQVHPALGLGTETETEDGLRRTAENIRKKLDLTTVVVHPKESAACATRDGTWWVPGPYAAKPLITTGAGDHFNSGFVDGQLMGLSPEACLTLGVITRVRGSSSDIAFITDGRTHVGARVPEGGNYQGLLQAITSV